MKLPSFLHRLFKTRRYKELSAIEQRKQWVEKRRALYDSFYSNARPSSQQQIAYWDPDCNKSLDALNVYLLADLITHARERDSGYVTTPMWSVPWPVGVPVVTSMGGSFAGAGASDSFSLPEDSSSSSNDSSSDSNDSSSNSN